MALKTMGESRLRRGKMKVTINENDSAYWSEDDDVVIVDLTYEE